MTANDLDMWQQRWQAQDAKLDQALRINARLLQRSEMAAPRASLRWLRFGSVFNILLGALFMLWTGSFISSNWGEWSLVLAVAPLHLWLMAATATTVLELVLASGIDYDAPIVQIQSRLAAIRVANLRALRWLFVTGVPVWTVSLIVLLFQALFGVDLVEKVGAGMVLALFLGHLALGYAIVAFGRWVHARFADSPGMRDLVDGLAGYNLQQAEQRLGRFAAFERGD
jgi:hypothetical protein